VILHHRLAKCLIVNAVCVFLQGIVLAVILAPTLARVGARELALTPLEYYMFCATPASIWFAVLSVILCVKLATPSTTQFSERTINTAIVLLFFVECLMPVFPIAIYGILVVCSVRRGKL
jgi:hypothetical protein